MLQEALAKAAAKHRERRTYIRQELNALYHLFLDTPGLLGPKFPVSHYYSLVLSTEVMLDSVVCTFNGKR